MQQLDLFAEIEQKIEEQHQKVVAQNDVQQKHYHSITEVAKMFNVNASLLRFWEKEFPQIKLRKNGKGDRLYTAENIKLIGTIYYLTKERRYTLEGTRAYLKENKKTSNKEVDVVKRLTDIRKFFVALKNEL